MPLALEVQQTLPHTTDTLVLGLAIALNHQLRSDASETTALHDMQQPSLLEHWPAGPGPLTPAQVQELIEQLHTAACIVGANPPGVTRGRLSPLLPNAARASAQAVMAWLDAAGVLTAPQNETLRWREPRLVSSTDLDWIAAQLRQTPW